MCCCFLRLFLVTFIGKSIQTPNIGQILSRKEEMRKFKVIPVTPSSLPSSQYDQQHLVSHSFNRLDSSEFSRQVSKTIERDRDRSLKQDKHRTVAVSKVMTFLQYLMRFGDTQKNNYTDDETIMRDPSIKNSFQVTGLQANPLLNRKPIVLLEKMFVERLKDVLQHIRNLFDRGVSPKSLENRIYPTSMNYRNSKMNSLYQTFSHVSSESLNTAPTKQATLSVDNTTGTSPSIYTVFHPVQKRWWAINRFNSLRSWRTGQQSSEYRQRLDPVFYFLGLGK